MAERPAVNRKVAGSPPAPGAIPESKRKGSDAMNRIEAEDCILMELMYRGPATGPDALYDRMQSATVKGVEIDTGEFAKLMGDVIDQNLIFFDHDKDAWYLTAKGVERCAVPPEFREVAEQARNEALYATHYSKMFLTLTSCIGGIGRNIAEAIDRQNQILHRQSQVTEAAGDCIERGLDNLADAINGLTDAVRGQPTCADADREDEER